MRLLKEKFSESEMMKQANRRGFSTETGEYGDDAMGLTLGMLERSSDGSGTTGNIRHMAGSAAMANKRKMRQANTKASRKKAAQMNRGGGGALSSGVSGLESSMVFTPVQGLELVNPDAMRERVKAANNKWFSGNSGFQSALPKKK